MTKDTDYRYTGSKQYPDLFAKHVTSQEFHDEIQGIVQETPFRSVSYCICSEIEEINGFHQLEDNEVVSLSIDMNAITATYMKHDQIDRIEQAVVYYIAADDVYGVVYTYQQFRHELYVE